jgi:hypothetical protein
MIFSVTEIGSFMRCRRMWFEGSFNGNALTQPKPAVALYTGSMWHRGHELVLETSADQAAPSADMAMGQAFEQMKAGIDDNLIASRGHGLTSDEAVDMQEQADLLEAMAINYEAYWTDKGAYPLPAEFDLIQAEQTCVVPVVGTPHSLEATLDGLMRHRATGLVYVLERKTFERHPALEMLDMEFQFTAYMWVVEQLGFQPGGVAYDGAWKRKSPPRGRTIDDLFLRLPISHSQAWLDDFQEGLIQQVQDMAEACYNPAKRYPNFNTFTSGCGFCAVRPVCIAMSNGEDADAVRKALYVPRDVGNRAAVWSKGEQA